MNFEAAAPSTNLRYVLKSGRLSHSVSYVEVKMEIVKMTTADYKELYAVFTAGVTPIS